MGAVGLDAAVVGGTTMMDVWLWPEVSGSDTGPGAVVASTGTSSNPGPYSSNWEGLMTSAGLLGLWFSVSPGYPELSLGYEEGPDGLWELSDGASGSQIPECIPDSDSDSPSEEDSDSPSWVSPDSLSFVSSAELSSVVFGASVAAGAAVVALGTYP